jgi:AraC-like DNA-binding protein
VYRHSARFLKPFVRVLRRHPSVPRDVVDEIDAVGVDDWVPYSRSAEFCQWAVARTGNPDLGLHAATAIEPGDLDVLEFAARSCANFAEAIDVVNRYIALLREGAAFTFERHGDHCAWNFTMAMRMPRVINDWTVAVYVLLGRAMSDAPGLHTEVHVTHAKPCDTREYERILQIPVRFGQDDNRLIIPSSVLALPIKGADARLHAVMRRYAGDLLQRRPAPERFSDRVRVAATETLRGNAPGAAAVASKLHMSERTLSRKLHDEGTTVLEIFDDVRKQLALSYLEQPELSIAEISFLLGFRQTPAFSRAFKRWTGASPIEHRKLKRLRSVS